MCLSPSTCDRRPGYLGFIWRKSIKSSNQIVLIWFFFPYNSGHQQPSIMAPNLPNLRLVWICSVCGHPHPTTHTNHGMFWTHGTTGGASCYISDRRFYQKADQAGSSSWVETKSAFLPQIGCVRMRKCLFSLSTKQSFPAHKPEKNFSSLRPMKTLGNYPPCIKWSWLVLFACFVLDKPLRYHPKYAKSFLLYLSLKTLSFSLRLWSLTCQDCILWF